MIDFPTEYPKIIKRLHAIDPLQYAKTRNFTDGAVTYLSPYISRGVISTRQVVENVLKQGHPSKDIQKFVQELAWREYFQRMWKDMGAAIWNDIRRPQPNVLHHQFPISIENAATGIAALDQHIQNLYNTGYMHNHVRMYTASIACNIAKAHWLQPARWLYYNLLDGDIASNTCSWQWVAGSFSTKKYYCNQENINAFTKTEQRHTSLDVGYELLPSLPVPLTLQETKELNLSTTLPIPKEVILDPLLPLVIYNSYNLDPLWRKEMTANRLLVLEPSHFQEYPVSQKVIEFVLQLAQNISDIQIYIGEISDIPNLKFFPSIHSKDHPAFTHYPGIKDELPWMFPSAKADGSFSVFWKSCLKQGLCQTN